MEEDTDTDNDIMGPTVNDASSDKEHIREADRQLEDVNEEKEQDKEDEHAWEDIEIEVADPEITTEMNYQEYNIESIKDKSELFEIRGVTVTKTPGNILICDHGNLCIKYLDQHFNVVNRLPVVYEPWDVAVVDEVYVVVTFPFVRLMQYFKFKTKTRLVHWFPFKSQNEYYGVCADRERIIATCKYNIDTESNVPSVHVLDRDGIVERVIDKNANGENLFIDPNHIALNSSTQVIYVSDQGSKEVISLSLSGVVLARFAAVDLNPRGVTVDNSNGNIFVSNKDSVMQLNRDLSRIRTIKCKEIRMTNAYALTFCSKTDRLIVNMDGSALLRVFVI